MIGEMKSIYVALVLNLLGTGCASGGIWGDAAAKFRSTGSGAGKVIAIRTSDDGSHAEVLTYASLLEPRVTCYRLNDLSRVAKTLRLGDSLAAASLSSETKNGCVETKWWRRVGRLPKGDSIEAFRHDLAVRLLGIWDPAAMGRFVGPEATHLKKETLERMAAHLPMTLEAFESWGIDMSQFVPSYDESEDLREARIEISALRGQLSESDEEREFERKKDEELFDELVSILQGLLFVVDHVEGSESGRGHHPGLERHVDDFADVLERVRPPRR